MQKNQSRLGFTQDLFILPFDHRGSFLEKMFQIKGRAPTPEEAQAVSYCKNLVYQGFKKSIERGVPADKAGILVDEQFGTEILKDAKKSGYFTACPAEKSGQDEFDFEHGTDFGKHIHAVSPSFLKVLVRYNPASDPDLNRRQLSRLKELSDFCHTHSYKFMFELLVPASTSQLEACGGQVSRYDNEMRADLMVSAMKELQDGGVEPDVWKLEGLEKFEDACEVSDQARSNGRDDVGVIVLGRGENAEKVRHWLKTAARVPGLIGFAVGRTIFWEPLKQFRAGEINEDQAIDQISLKFSSFCELWMETRASNLENEKSPKRPENTQARL